VLLGFDRFVVLAPEAIGGETELIIEKPGMWCVTEGRVTSRRLAFSVGVRSDTDESGACSWRPPRCLVKVDGGTTEGMIP
jgi:hypothetical protein